MVSLEYVMKHYRKDGMMRVVKERAGAVEELADMALGSDSYLAWRSAWLLWSCMEANDDRVKPFVDRLLEHLPNAADNLKREIFKVLELLELSEEQEAVLFDICVEEWKSVFKKPGVRFNAFKILVKIIRKYPEMSDFLDLLTEDQYFDTMSLTARKSLLMRSRKK